VQRVLELLRNRPYRRGVGAVERQDRAEERDHARASRPSDRAHHLAAGRTGGPTGGGEHGHRGRQG
jgi:hypothetical protein